MSVKYNQLPDTQLDQIVVANADWPAFQREHPDAINTTVGVVLDPETNEPWRPQAVQQALNKAGKLIARESLYGYQTPAGHEGFLEQAKMFALQGEGSRGVLAYQSSGGTGALNLAKDALATIIPENKGGGRALLIDSGWPNHPAIFHSEFDITTYRHIDPETDDYDHQAAMALLEDAPDGSTVLFQVSGYNDDGVDRTVMQWDEVLETAADKDMTVILDAAYVGLSQDSLKDTYPIRKAFEDGTFSFICISMSKNMGLYNERLGALLIANAKLHLGDKQAANFDQTIKKLVRRTISSPPLLVASAAAMALKNVQYYDDLDEACDRIKANRTALTAIIGEQLPVVAKGHGLFTKLMPGGFSKAQQQVLKDAGIHALPSSRFNIGGLRIDQVGRVGEAILSALKA